MSKVTEQAHVCERVSKIFISYPYLFDFQSKTAAAAGFVYALFKSRDCPFEEILFSCNLRTSYNEKRDAGHCINKR